MSGPSPQRLHAFSPPVMLSPWNYGRAAYPTVTADGEGMFWIGKWLIHKSTTPSFYQRYPICGTLNLNVELRSCPTVLHSCVLPDAYLHSTTYITQSVTDTVSCFVKQINNIYLNSGPNKCPFKWLNKADVTHACIYWQHQQSSATQPIRENIQLLYTFTSEDSQQFFTFFSSYYIYPHFLS